MNNINERLREILRTYSCVVIMPDLHDKAEDVAVQMIKSLFGYEEGKSLEERKQEFYNECAKLVKEDRSNVSEVTNFYTYWIEHPEKVRINTKMRWEKEKTFSIKGRYTLWENRSKKYSIANMLRK